MIIDVREKSNNEFEVNIKCEVETFHSVTLSDSWYIKYTDEKLTKKRLVELSFEFLLDREPNTSILKEFNLDLIADFFPDYLAYIKKSCLKKSDK